MHTTARTPTRLTYLFKGWKGRWVLLSTMLLLGSAGLGLSMKGRKHMTTTAELPSAAQCSNRLRLEKSPYLLQHAGNPVDWYPWGPEAFEKARKEDKPVFLSIGYSTCHWCHVMEHESFENAEVARLMNDAFVCVKVDREERPDLDNVYMSVCQAMTGGGGWPLTIIMTPDKRPFYAGTYIPKEKRFGRIGMLELVPRIKELWATRRQELLQSADQVTTAIRRPANPTPGQDLTKSDLDMTFRQVGVRFDPVYGGFGEAPKFPTPQNLTFLLRYWNRTKDPRALIMVERTLEAMRLGGIYDHLGFGFHRYSTDERWLVPHFEKMLYDQALLAITYTEACQATGKPEYGEVAREIITYVLRDMTDRQGGFYSAEDADSEGEEGKFYLWTEQEVCQMLSGEEARLALAIFNVKPEGNFFGEASGRSGGANILHLTRSPMELASELKMSERDLRHRLEEIRRKLFARREKRVHPHKDDKILTDWNGLMIAALAKAAQAFDEPSYRQAARRSADFILETLRSPEGRLLHRYRDGQATLAANANDYAFFIWGLTELYEATFEVYYLRAALDLNRDMIEHFWDKAGGGFFFTADDGEELLVRQKEDYDGAIPSGNSVAMLNLLRLARMTANPDLEAKAAQLGRAFSEEAGKMPATHSQLMIAADIAIGPAQEVVIAGDPKAADTKAMIRAIRSRFLPNKVVLFRPSNATSPAITRLAPFTRDLAGIDGKATAYVCRDFQCGLPTTDPEKVLELLSKTD